MRFLKKSAAALIALFIFFSVTAFANEVPADISIVIDDSVLIPTDANGTIVVPFVEKGTTYVPVRAISQAFGLSVTWDQDNMTVFIGEKSGSPVLNDYINIYINGAELAAKDANGTRVYPLLVGGTTYMPIRAIGEALGKTVRWDDSAKTAYIMTNLADENKAATYMVGICQLVPHPALDAATQGFKDALTEQLGDAVKFDEQNAWGDANACGTIVNGFVSKNVDLIMANATAALLAATSATNTIPILGTSVTGYGIALDIDDFDGTVGGNISGTSDLAPMDKQAAMLMELFPEAKNVGLLYCSAEPNSLYQVKVVKECLEAAGVTAVEYPFYDSNDIAAVTASACSESDVIYVPTDNTVAWCTDIIDGICRPAGVPIIAGEEGICMGCGVATLSISYYELGHKTGLMAAEILANGGDISTMPIQYDDNCQKMYNKVIADELGIEVPEDYLVIEY